ncbi:MAG: hypothetical protein L0H36_00770 [bacterium]|nr:hypothetical protein [bacterium]MDN5835149.1 hypothetical protein [bacterium]
MLNIKKSKRLKKSRSAPKIILRITIVVAILAVLAGLGLAGYKFYLHLNENPSMSVEYKRLDPDNASTEARKYYPTVRLSVEHVTPTMKPGGETVFSFKTIPGTRCTVAMKDQAKQPYVDPKFVTKKADKKGFVSWPWKAKNVADGDVWTVTATCSNPSHSSDVSRDIKISSETEAETDKNPSNAPATTPKN